MLQKDQHFRDGGQNAGPMRAGNFACLKNAVDGLIDALVIQQKERGCLCFMLPPYAESW